MCSLVWFQWYNFCKRIGSTQQTIPLEANCPRKPQCLLFYYPHCFAHETSESRNKTNKQNMKVNFCRSGTPNGYHIFLLSVSLSVCSFVCSNYTTNVKIGAELGNDLGWWTQDNVLLYALSLLYWFIKAWILAGIGAFVVGYFIHGGQILVSFRHI